MSILKELLQLSEAPAHNDQDYVNGFLDEVDAKLKHDHPEIYQKLQKNLILLWDMVDDGEIEVKFGKEGVQKAVDAVVKKLTQQESPKDFGHWMAGQKGSKNVTIELDWDADADADTEEDLKKNVEHALKDHKMSGTTYKIKTMHGPGGGCPIVQFTGPEDELKKFLDAVYGDDDLDLYKVNESVQVDEKVFDEEKYDWYVWTERRPSPKIERRGGSVQLERGRVFGLRKATSKKDGTYRLVLKSHGPSIIYSIPERLAHDLANMAAPAH